MTTNPDRYTHGHDDSVLQAHRTRNVANSAAYLVPYLQAGQRLLDLGSGPGTITVELAELVGPSPRTCPANRNCGGVPHR